MEKVNEMVIAPQVTEQKLQEKILGQLEQRMMLMFQLLWRKNW